MSAVSYARAALDTECATLAATRRGRNAQANRSGFAMGQFVGAGMLDRGEVLNSLLTAATANGYVAQDGIGTARASILSGFSSGLRKPRAVPDGPNRDAAPARSSAPQPRPVPAVVDTHDTARLAERTARALHIWNEARDPYGTLSETYLASRGLVLDHEVAGTVLRFHGACPWQDENGVLLRIPAMVALMRSVVTDAPQAIQRTRLTTEGVKVARKMLGPSRGAAIKLTPDEDVTHGLAIGEGLETCMSAMALGIKPCWATGSSGGIARFPVLSGIEALTILAEHDEANRKASEVCATRWHAAGYEVLIVEPMGGNDLNDAMQGAA